MDAYQSATEAKVVKETIASAVSKFDRSNERLEKIFAALDMLGDQLEGTRPRDATTGAAIDPPPPSALLDNLTRKGRRQAELLSRCEDAISRIQAALG